MQEKDNLLEFIKQVKEKITLHKEISNKCNTAEDVLNFHDEIIQYCNELEKIISEKELKVNYIELFQNDLVSALNFFPYKDNPSSLFNDSQNKELFKGRIENDILNSKDKFNALKFNLDFFKKLGFFSANIVAIGANGSGKTSLSNNLKKYLPGNGVVIGAQKVMIIPTISGIPNFENTRNKILQYQNNDKSLKETYSTENNGNSWQIMQRVGGEFQALLDNLIAERSAIRNSFLDSIPEGKNISDIPCTNLDKALKIWNFLIEHRIIKCEGGLNINLSKPGSNESYPAFQMSDGEKVTLYLIAHILQAPPNGFIIVDEPEMYLHKTILRKLWDTLEMERQDCIFIYLTHDLDFATSRITAKKVWIKSFNHPDSWEIESIPENELPESLLMELLGSRKNILFCEGKKGSVDEKIYNILFPNYTITPVEGCFNVINYTKAYNKIPNITTKAFGIIDSDYHEKERLSKLENENIYSLQLADIENLFFDEDFLKLISERLLTEMSNISEVKKSVFDELGKSIELQTSNFISTKINNYFKDSDVSKGNTLDEVKQNYLKFSTEIKVEDWYNGRKNELEKIVLENDYKKAISVFNNKGLHSIANNKFMIRDFLVRSIKFLETEKNSHQYLLKYFPEGLKNGVRK